MPRLLKRMKNLFRKPLRKAAARYQPEKHYMRGPGPKTVAKQRAEMRVEPLPQ